MTELKWGQAGDKTFETGVEKGVLFTLTNGLYDTGVAWNGLTAVTESPSGAEPTKLYADNGVYATLISAEEFAATVEAYYYPPQFAACDGTAVLHGGVAVGQQSRKSFGLTWQSKIGNDLSPDAGTKIKIVYGATAAPSEKTNNTINDSPEAGTFSWELSTTPVAVTGLKPTAILTIDSTKVPSANFQALKDALYGTAGSDPRLPSPDEVIAMFAGALTTVTPAAPTATAAGVITIVPTTGVKYIRTDTGATVTGTVTIPTLNQTVVIRALPLASYVLAADVDTDWGFKKTA